MTFMDWQVSNMFFSEIYSAYYNTVAAVLSEAVTHPVSKEELRKIIEKYAFGESVIAIPEAIIGGRWPLIKADGTTVIKHPPSLPLTQMQKSWLKAIACDPRIKLFGDISFDFPDVEPLFQPSDVITFDKYLDGDPYADEAYIANFRLILDAIVNKYPLRIEALNRKGNLVRWIVCPEYLEYSEKDDKFRLIGAGNRFGGTINLGRIISCRPYEKPYAFNPGKRKRVRTRNVIFELTDKRNSLERVLLHFAHFEKTAERMEDDRYRITIHYDKEDETEIVIRILAFGPMVRVVAPQYFVELIKQRLKDQKNCG